jgi:DNA-directed RNA polymerase specialized sigma24 family protein
VLFLVRVNLGRKLRSKVESWDIAQEALMKSLRDLKKFRYESDNAFRRYLSRKVQEVIRDQADYWSAGKRDVNRERDVYRSPVNAANTVAANEGIADYRNHQSPSELLCLDEDLNCLAEALDELADQAPDQWDVIVQVKLIGRALSDVAAERKTTSDAIKMKVRRGMLKLASIFRHLQS